MSRYRVWHIPQVPMPAFTVDTDSLAVAVALTDVLAAYDAFQLEHRVKPDYVNAGGVSELDEDGGWYDVDTDSEFVRPAARVSS